MKSLFHQHSVTPHKNQRTIIVSTKSTFEAQGQKMELFLDIGPDEEIKDAGFTYKGCDLYVPYASMMCEKLIGLSLDEARDLSAQDLYDEFSASEDFLERIAEESLPVIMLPLTMLREAIADYVGRPKARSEVLPFDQADLLCRCFGVYGKQVRDLIKANPKFGVSEITRELKAGGGCTSCLEDLEEIVEELGEKSEVVDEALLLKISSVLKVWLKHSETVKKFAEGSVQATFDKEVDGTLFFHFRCESSVAGKDVLMLKENLQKYLFDHLPKDKTIYLSTNS